LFAARALDPQRDRAFCRSDDEHTSSRTGWSSKAKTAHNDVTDATAGIVTLGTSEIDIPPGATGYPVETTCTQRMEFPLTAIASSPHMHGRGRAIRTDVLRDGAVVASLADEPSFDPERQHTRPLSPGVVLQPGVRVVGRAAAPARDIGRGDA